MDQLKHILECMLIDCDYNNEYVDAIDVIDNILNVIDTAITNDSVCCKVTIERLQNIIKEYEGIADED